MNKSIPILEGNQQEIFDQFDIKSALEDYLKNALLRELKQGVASQAPDVTYVDNVEFWKEAIAERLFEGQIVKLVRFKILEWIPTSPGLYHTTNAKQKRDAAIINYGHREINQFNNIFFPQIKKDIIELAPDQKMGMVQGGYGSLRITSKIIDNERQFILCATSNGVSHEGIPIFLRKIHYDKITEMMRRGRIPVANLVCRVMVLPRDISLTNLRYAARVPKFYLEILDLDVVEYSPPRESLISIAILYSARDTYIRDKRFSYSFCSFHPNINNQSVGLKIATDWLSKYARKYSNDIEPIIVGDFDEKYDHFENVAFHLRDLMSGRIPLDRLNLFSGLFHLEINELHMSDTNIINNSQVGAVGTNAVSTNNTFHQVNYTLPANFDLEGLDRELTLLRERLQTQARTSEQFRSIAEVTDAQAGIQERNESKIVYHLKKAGKWVYEVARDIGVGLVTEIILKEV